MTIHVPLCADDGSMRQNAAQFTYGWMSHAAVSA